MKPVDAIRAAISIEDVVGEYIKLRKTGANFVGLCPFHQEKTPSFSVHPVRRIFHCFGCGVGGDVFKFVMMIENITFPEAAERLAEKAHVALPERWSNAQDSAEAKEKAALYALHEAAARFFASQLGATIEGRAARAYLDDRGVSAEAIARFRLGYAPSDGAKLADHLAGAGFSTELLEKAGLVVPGRDGRRPLDRFRRRIIFPIANESGKVVAFAGRSLGDEEPKYLNSPETPLYTKSRVLYNLHAAAIEIRRQDSAVLVEGYMDAIALASHGVAHVVASCGTSLTANQVRLLGRSTRRIVVNFDPDSAGMAATERSLGLLLEEGFEVRVLALPGGLDPDSFIRQRGAEAYLDLLSKAPSYLDYLTERAAATHGLATPEGKVRAANALLPYLAKISNPLLRDETAAKIAERLRLDRQLLREELKRAARSGEREIRLQDENAVLKPSLAEKELLWAILSDASLAAELLGAAIQEELFANLACANLFQVLWTELSRSGDLDIHRLFELLSPAEQHLVAELEFALGEPPDRERAAAAVDALRRLKLKSEAASLRAELERAQRDNDQAALSRLLEQKQRAAKLLRSSKV